MVDVVLYENGEIIRRIEMPAVPRIGESLTYGYGKEYRLFQVTDVTWDTSSDESVAMRANLTLSRYLK